jgi:hypothetical protein
MNGAAGMSGTEPARSLRAPQVVLPRIAKDAVKFNAALPRHEYAPLCHIPFERDLS